MCFSRETLRYVTLSMPSSATITQCRISWTGVWRCWHCPTNRLGQISGQHWYEVLPILGVLKWDFPFGVSQLCKNLGLNFNNRGAHFSVGKIIYRVGNFGQWVGWIYWVDKLIYLVGINLLFTSLPKKLGKMSKVSDFGILSEPKFLNKNKVTDKALIGSMLNISCWLEIHRNHNKRIIKSYQY